MRGLMYKIFKLDFVKLTFFEETSEKVKILSITVCNFIYKWGNN